MVSVMTCDMSTFSCNQWPLQFCHAPTQPRGSRHGPNVARILARPRRPFSRQCQVSANRTVNQSRTVGPLAPAHTPRPSFPSRHPARMSFAAYILIKRFEKRCLTITKSIDISLVLIYKLFMRNTSDVNILIDILRGVRSQ